MLARIEELTSRQSRDKCNNCGRPGHTKEKCWRKGGGSEGQYPTWWRGKRDNDSPQQSTSNPSSNIAIGDFPQIYGMAAIREEGSGTGEIYADSGASDHFFKQRSDFVTYEACNRIGQSSEKGTPLNIIGVGRVKKTLVGNGKPITVIHFRQPLSWPS